MAEELKETDLVDFEGGTKSFRKKANALMGFMRKLLAEKSKGKRGPYRLYLNTDSEPVVIEIEAIIVDTGASGPLGSDL